MEDRDSPVSSGETWAEAFAQALGQQRGRVKEFLAAQRQRLDRAQTDLANQVERISAELARSESESARAREEIEHRSQEVEQRMQSLAQWKDEVESRQAAWQASQERLLEQYATLFQKHQQDLSERQAALEKRREEVAALEAQLHEERQALDLARREHAAEVKPEEYDQLRQERDRLAERLAELEKQSKDDSSSGNEYRRRYELAMDDVREMKSRIQELERSLAQARANAPQAPGSVTSGGLDWEAEKRRIMAALEAEAEADDDPEAAQERLRIQDIIRSTEQALSDRDREIEELKQLLENQSTNLGSVAVGAAALGAVLDQDAIIQEERENLRRIQAEWEEKLRAAEIEISIERAKIARERALVEDRLKELETRKDKPPTDSENADKAPSGDKPVRGRWLARLGLKDDEQQ